MFDLSILFFVGVVNAATLAQLGTFSPLAILRGQESASASGANESAFAAG
jgi:hypothetical protein